MSHVDLIEPSGLSSLGKGSYLYSVTFRPTHLAASIQAGINDSSWSNENGGWGNMLSCEPGIIPSDGILDAGHVILFHPLVHCRTCYNWDRSRITGPMDRLPVDGASGQRGVEMVLAWQDYHACGENCTSA